MPTKLELTLDKLAVSVDATAKKAYTRLIGLINQGVKPQEALNAVYLSFSAGSVNAGYLAALNTAFTTILQRPFTTTELLHYPVGNVTLSSKLYANAKLTSEQVATAIQNNVDAFMNLRKVSLDLYSGYNQVSNEVLKVTTELPKYLQEAIKPFASEIDIGTAKLLASDLKTDGLRAAYSTLLDKIESGASKKALDNAIRTAAYERNRMLANRVGQTEVARAYNRKVGKDLVNREDIDWVQARPRGNHKSDRCDIYLFSDNYGMGEGVYPKDKAPVFPVHPHCRCALVARVDLKANPAAKLDPNAERDYLSSLSEEDQKLILPEGGRQALANGQSITDYLNSRISNPDYRIITTGEL
jgi:hypothetical protein